MITDSISGQFSFLNVSDPPFEYNLTSVQCGGETGDGDIFCSDIEMIIILIRGTSVYNYVMANCLATGHRKRTI